MSDAEDGAQPLEQARPAPRASCVARKIVSSPEIVPTTSGQLALSMATATLLAAPTVVRTTVSEGPAVRTACARNGAARRNRPGRGATSSLGGR